MRLYVRDMLFRLPVLARGPDLRQCCSLLWHRASGTATVMRSRHKLSRNGDRGESPEFWEDENSSLLVRRETDSSSRMLVGRSCYLACRVTVVWWRWCVTAGERFCVVFCSTFNFFFSLYYPRA